MRTRKIRARYRQLVTTATRWMKSLDRDWENRVDGKTERKCCVRWAQSALPQRPVGCTTTFVGGRISLDSPIVFIENSSAIKVIIFHSKGDKKWNRAAINVASVLLCLTWSFYWMLTFNCSSISICLEWGRLNVLNKRCREKLIRFLQSSWVNF